MRIASLLPAATEILCALGLEKQIVGVSHECDFPPSLKGRTVLTEPKIDPRGTSAAIDDAVRALVREGLSIYRIKEDALRELRPDVIVTQDQCEVCAVPFSDVEKATRAWLGENARIVSLQPRRLGDVLGSVRSVAAATGTGEQGERLMGVMKSRLDAIVAQLKDASYQPRVACIEWMDPLMVGGHWIPELVEIAGGTYGFLDPGDRSATVSWNTILNYAPEVVVVMPCGFRLEQTRRELPSLIALPEWQELPAVQNGRAYAVDGNAYFNRPGPRIVDSAEILAWIIQPQFFTQAPPANSCERLGSPPST